MSLISALFQEIFTVITEFGSVFVGLFDNITDIFFTVADGAHTLTPIGTLSLCAFGIGLVWTGIRWLSRLIKMRG